MGTIHCPDSITLISLHCDELTALCPGTRQPDCYQVIINYAPNGRALESKALKFYLQEFRSVEIYAESLADRIVDDVMAFVTPSQCMVRLIQKRRGGIEITVESKKCRDLNL